MKGIDLTQDDERETLFKWKCNKIYVGNMKSEDCSKGQWLRSCDACFSTMSESALFTPVYHHDVGGTYTYHFWIDTCSVEKQTEISIAAMLVVYKLTERIGEKSSLTCYGCHGEVDFLPSQNDHMSGGCLAPWDEKVAGYFYDAYNSIPWRQLFDTHKHLLPTLDIDTLATILNCELGLPCHDMDENRKYVDKLFDVLVCSTPDTIPEYWWAEFN